MRLPGFPKPLWPTVIASACTLHVIVISPRVESAPTKQIPPSNWPGWLLKSNPTSRSADGTDPAPRAEVLQPQASSFKCNEASIDNPSMGAYCLGQNFHGREDVPWEFPWDVPWDAPREFLWDVPWDIRWEFPSDVVPWEVPRDIPWDVPFEFP